MLTNKILYPKELGFVMPAEWEPHTATWSCWPFDDEMWFGKLKEVRTEYADFIKTIAQHEKVHLITKDDEAYRTAKSFLGENITNIDFHKIPLNDIWFRDNGPIFIKQKNEKNEIIKFVKWEFNSWGQKFKWDLDNEASYTVAKYLNMDFFKTGVVMEGGSLDVNGEGIALTTRQCLLSKMRNPHLSQNDIEKYLENYLGIKKLLWLDNGLEGDHTDGHIDTIVRFVDRNTIICSITNDKSDINFETMNHNFKLLESYTNLHGEKFKIIPLLLPKNKMWQNEDRLPCTYANFYIGNNFVAVPQYDDPHDKIALETLEPLFAKRKVIGLSSKYIICGGGSFHCMTQQQPAPLLT